MAEFVLATVLGLLFAIGTFLVLRRDVVRVVWGVSIISQAANLYLVTAGIGLTGDPNAAVPVLGHGGAEGAVADPLVQALVLTAIVIGFGTTAFALVLTFRVYEEHGTIDLEDLATNPFVTAGTAMADGGREATERASDGDASTGTDAATDTTAGPAADTDDGGER
jgi:multicomponent Na+:H+ antiporter subunit C